uniref:Major capsid protein n=1 Tax=Dulem virus 199 TaxID=3145676 RepID=A0AAU8AVJ2_9VIRU
MNLSKTANHFSMIPRAEIPRSRFNRSYTYKTTCNSGDLIPFDCDFAYPGDTFDRKVTIFGRLSTPVVPVLDNIWCEYFYFGVPVRLVWNNWQKFNGEQENPGDSTDYLIPQLSSGTTVGFENGSLSDYMGLPTGIPNLSVSSLWHRAYNLIYNEWFRDQNLIDSAEVPKGDNGDSVSIYPIRKRAKQHDYFTSALPWPQKGPGVELPLGTSAPLDAHLTFFPNATMNKTGASSVSLSVPMFRAWGQSEKSLMLSGSDTGGFGSGINPTVTGVSIQGADVYGGDNTGDNGVLVWDYSRTANLATGLGVSGTADLRTATAATINSLRQAFQLQKVYERDARGGTRYTEIIRAHFGVVSPDARLQRPEYLGGGKTRLVINSVAQTASTDSTSPQGNLAAYSYFSKTGRAFIKSFTEHTLILGLINFYTDLSYQQGIPRQFSYLKRFDFYLPAFAFLGEQPVLNKEIFATGTSTDNSVFGYQERWAEMRYRPSMVTGKMRSNDEQSLDFWHFAQDFSTVPSLNETFINADYPIKRSLAVHDEPEFLVDIGIESLDARPLPVYSVPGLVDHF